MTVTHINAAPEPEESPEMTALTALRDDINSQVERVKSIYHSGQLTPEIAMEELCETFLPLMQDIVERAHQTQSANEDFMGAVDEKLWPDGNEPPAEEDAPGLWPEDAEPIKALLGHYREMLVGSRDEANAVRVDAEVQLIDRVLKRVNELVLSDEDDGETEEPPN